jgi:hypothetical protein
MGEAREKRRSWPARYEREAEPALARSPEEVEAALVNEAANHARFYGLLAAAIDLNYQAGEDALKERTRQLLRKTS